VRERKREKHFLFPMQEMGAKIPPRELFFNRYRISVLQDEKISADDGNDSSTAM
jgi:hypothetical protein